MHDFTQITFIVSFPLAMKITVLAKFLPFLRFRDAIFRTANWQSLLCFNVLDLFLDGNFYLFISSLAAGALRQTLDYKKVDFYPKIYW